MTLEELKNFDGKDGRRAYIAFKGDVYDVTESKMWKNGSHARKHNAGQDLTDAIAAAPHAESVLQRYPKVDTLASGGSTAAESDSTLQKLYAKFHPHPIIVHLPMGLIPFALFMQLLYVCYDNTMFFQVGYYAIIGAFIGSIGALFSGTASWGINYGFACTHAFMIKIVASVLLLVLLAIEIVLGMNYALCGVYTVLLVINMLIATIIGYIGGKLTGF